MNKLSVSDLVFNIKDLLESNFMNLTVEGEVTNFSKASSGHYYFSLSDNQAMVGSALFRGDAMRNPFVRKMKDGDKVLVSGSINVYPKRGNFQIIVKRIVPVGKGDLKEQFEILKKKLAGQGMFDLDKKLKIPSFPKKVAIITAKNGAALQDFINIYNRRSLAGSLVLVPSLMQGLEADKSVINAIDLIERYNKKNQIDLIVITRGGGSLEDLWAFNSEELAKKIFSCKIPIISAIGHEVDFTICDFVSDLRAETPSAAAEIITSDQIQLKARLIDAKKSLNFVVHQKINESKSNLENLNPKAVMNGIWSNFAKWKNRLFRLNLNHRMEKLSKLNDYKLRLDDSNAAFFNYSKNYFNSTHLKLSSLYRILHGLNPKGVLSRGYCYASNSEGKVIDSHKSFKKVESGATMEITFHDGVGRVQKIKD